ncbi:mycothione reductase [Actinomycetospora sp. OC33-EN08]|uniref:Mycothione reductase n=1 Tax=Actinomycetospora aurantiaca TaxID=3129233 RepID=A0ABU8MKK2_9PSEU
MPHHDLVIIGSGSGNSILDSRFDDWDVAIVEHGVFGGTCLNVGCIPTKMYVYASDVAETVRRAGTYGVDASIDKVRWTDIRDRVFGRIDPISAGGLRYRDQESANVTVYQGHAVFTGERALEVTPTAGGAGETVTADRFVIAAGSRPTVPAVIADSGVPFHTSDDVMRLPDLPRRLTILGGGYIACEFAHVFSALGVEVTVVTRGPALLRDQDETVSERFTRLAQDRWNVHLSSEPTAAEQRADGTVVLTCPQGETIEGDALLVATGRVPGGDRLDVGRTGLSLTDDGRVEVDEYQRTPVAGIWALGDVSSPHQLKHVANHEAKVVQHNLLHPDTPRATSHRFVPSAVFTDPQVATVGAREQDLRDAGTPYVAKDQAYGDVAFGWAMEDTTGFAKVLASPSGELLGAHLMGPQASSLIQLLVQAMVFGQNAREVATAQYWIHPALPELIENALLGLPLSS